MADMSGHLVRLGKSLSGSVDSYNRAVGSIESRVLVTARKFKDLDAADGKEAIESLSPVEQATRPLTADEFLALPEGEEVENEATAATDDEP